MSRSLTLIAPEIGPALATAIAERGSRWPQLARLAGRGEVRIAAQAGNALHSWQAALLAAIGIHDHERYPSAAVTRTGDSGERAAGFWLHASPLHLAAGLDRLTAVPLHGANRIDDGERTQLEAVLGPHLRTAGFELLRTAGGEWLVHSDQVLAVRTATPEAAAANPLDELMPEGPDAAVLRRLMTELQMLLHEHAVNAQRERQGMPPINAVWLHGSGALQSVEAQALPQAFGDHPYLRGIYRLHDAALTASPQDAESLLSQMAARAVSVIPIEDLDVLETVWLAPLARALGSGAIGELQVVLDDWRIVASRTALLRFWRRPRALAQWAAC